MEKTVNERAMLILFKLDTLTADHRGLVIQLAEVISLSRGQQLAKADREVLVSSYELALSVLR
jgi:hypothetical protein